MPDTPKPRPVVTFERIKRPPPPRAPEAQSWQPAPTYPTPWSYCDACAPLRREVRPGTRLEPSMVCDEHKEAVREAGRRFAAWLARPRDEAADEDAIGRLVARWIEEEGR
jgi:hypothetical protein